VQADMISTETFQVCFRDNQLELQIHFLSVQALRKNSTYTHLQSDAFSMLKKCVIF